jgi:hypothetical protein
MVLIGRERLVRSVPQMASKDFGLYEAHERKYHLPVDSPMQLVVCEGVEAQLGDTGVRALGEAVLKYNVTVVPKTGSDRHAPQLCYEPRWQSPFLAVAETWLGPQYVALGGNGFHHYYLHLFGGWVHLYSRMVWVS